MFTPKSIAPMFSIASSSADLTGFFLVWTNRYRASGPSLWHLCRWYTQTYEGQGDLHSKFDFTPEICHLLSDWHESSRLHLRKSDHRHPGFCIRSRIGYAEHGKQKHSSYITNTGAVDWCGWSALLYILGSHQGNIWVWNTDATVLWREWHWDDDQQIQS